MIKISNRLKLLGDITPDNSSIADIGCDHAILDIYLSEVKNNIKIIASDINKNALNMAIKNINKYGKTNIIKTILSDGLNNIDTTNVDVIIISGLGTSTITNILNNSKIKNINTIILQSNNHLEILRREVTKLGFYIEEEYIIKENNIYYVIIKFQRGKKTYTNLEYKYGPVLLKERPSTFMEYLNVLKSKNKNILKEIPQSNTKEINKIKEDIKQIEEIIN